MKDDDRDRDRHRDIETERESKESVLSKCLAAAADGSGGLYSPEI